MLSMIVKCKAGRTSRANFEFNLHSQIFRDDTIVLQQTRSVSEMSWIIESSPLLRKPELNSSGFFVSF